jgi:hypothetical protein
MRKTTEGKIQNGQARDTSNIVYKTQDNEKQNTTLRTKYMSNTDPPKSEVNPSAREW